MKPRFTSFHEYCLKKPIDFQHNGFSVCLFSFPEDVVYKYVFLLVSIYGFNIQYFLVCLFVYLLNSQLLCVLYTADIY